MTGTKSRWHPGGEASGPIAIASSGAPSRPRRREDD
jgi:hypothetical protein